ncbi:hypothetical protein GGR28_003025 [Lewinella aquimaris]|uniref:Outer membrane protein beta-barrel domain-containing protein n=1 Tax=Neolewinella aquimaris TaxID=1835722 RepID=A0A840E5D5_9BACT|nr:outer membrane beta-barrel protein [Neolewinella aquimaris]MBB4080391.1 hypothetical protein [Neolewinella aquimaris]
MSQLDDLFREGLGDRRPDVPQDMWQRIAANKAPVPTGEQLDRLFADALAERKAAVPAGMWARIVAARKTVNYRLYAAALLLLLLAAGGLTYYVTGAGTQEQGTLAMTPTSFPVAVPDNASAGPDRDLKASTSGTPSAVLNTANGAQTATTYLNTERAGVEADPSGPVAASASISPTTAPPTEQARRTATLANAIAVLPTNPIPTRPRLPAAGPIALSEGNSFRGSGRRRLQVEVLAGAAYANQSFRLREEGSQGLRDAREVSEFPEVSFQVSARLNYRLRNRLHLVTGLTYAELRNRFEYERAIRSGQELMHSSNRIRMLEVPLLASYQLPGRRFHLSVNAGPLVNVMTGVSGKFLDPGSVVPRDLSDAGDYRSNVGLGWTASLTTTYLVGKQGTTQLLLEPFFKHYPTSFTTSDAGLSERYWVAGLQLGLRKQFR